MKKRMARKISLVVPDELYKILVCEANESERSISDVVRDILTVGVYDYLTGVKGGNNADVDSQGDETQRLAVG